MARSRTCDVCRQEAEIVAKLYLTPANTRSDHNNYTAHIDVGQCCLTKVHQLARWQKRKVRVRVKT